MEIEQRAVGDVALQPGDIVEIASGGQPRATIGRSPTLTKIMFGGELNSQAVELPAPTYPTAARLARAKGRVEVEVIVDERGEVSSSRIASGHPLLSDAATGAARGARFSPQTVEGHPVKVLGLIGYDFALTPAAEAAAYSEEGSLRYETGRYEEAVEAYKDAIRLAPKDPAVYNKLGAAYSALKRNKEAVEAFKRAVSLDPALVEARLNLGNAYNDWHRYKEAVKAFKEALRLKPETAEAHFGLGLAYVSLGERVSAEKELQILQRLQPKLADELFDKLSGMKGNKA